MNLLTINQIQELNECIMLSKTCKILDKYTRAEWIKAYMYIIAPAGVDTFCESNTETYTLYEKLKSILTDQEPQTV